MSESETLKVLKDIVSGFVEMGERRFLHRDLKLANIFMNEGNAIIADFGFAKKHTYLLIDITVTSQSERNTMSAVLFTCHLRL